FVSGGFVFGGPKERFPARLIQIPDRSWGSNFFPFTSTRLVLLAGLAGCGAVVPAGCGAVVPAGRCPPVCGRAKRTSEKTSNRPGNGKRRIKRFFIDHTLFYGARTSRSCRRLSDRAEVLPATSPEERFP